jgi:hypothetical protein
MNPKTWLNPRPVPRPGPLVVKKGSTARSRASGDMPTPVSETMMATKKSGGDHHQEVIEIMCNAARKLPQSFELL